MAATAIYCGTSGAATSCYISDGTNPPTNGTYVIYLNPNSFPEKWNSKALASYDAPGDKNDVILGGNMAGSFTVQNCKITVSGATPTHLNNFKKAFQYWSINDTELYLWEKNVDGYNLAQMYNNVGSLTQIKVKWFGWQVTKKGPNYWQFNMFLQRVSSATAID